MATVETHYYDSLDVLYVKRAGVMVDNTKKAQSDDLVTFCFDSSGLIVGVRIIAASALSKQSWKNHLDRKHIPADLDEAVLQWIK